MTMPFAYRASLSISSRTQTNMVFYKWIRKIIAHPCLITKITWFHKISYFSTLANLALVWTASEIWWLICVLIYRHKIKSKFPPIYSYYILTLQTFTFNCIWLRYFMIPRLCNKSLWINPKDENILYSLLFMVSAIC